MPDENILKLKKETYLKMVENSEGTRIFNTAFVKNNETKDVYDIFENGTYSGAFYVSGLLYLLGMIDKPHATVQTLREAMINTGYREVGEGDYEPGDILIYDFLTFEDGTKSDQVGIFIDRDTAYSTSYHKRSVIKHHPTFGEENGIQNRRITAAYRHNFDNNLIKYNINNQNI